MTETGSDHPVTTCTMTAVAKNLIPSAKMRVKRKIPDAIFWMSLLNLSPNIS